MATTLVLRRLRRSLPIATTVLRPLHHPFSPPPPISAAASLQNPKPLVSPFQSRTFKSSPTMSLARPNNYGNGSYDDDQLDPNEIIFEGCDYKHWLITIDFPKDPRPSDEEMVEFYVQTAAKIVGSVEEAKKRIYACSTSTYHGFQIEVSEEDSEKFQGLPGVVFVLPDSYIDPVNKEYGGDKYENGVITHRPPPVQYGRHGGRYNDRNREYNRPERRPMGQGNYQGGQGNYQGGQGNYQGVQGNYQGGQGNYQGGQGNYGYSTPPNNAAPGRQGNYQGNFPPPGQRNFVAGQGNFRPPSQGERRNYPPGQRDFPPNNQINHPFPGQRDFSGDSRTAPSEGGNFGQGAGGGNYGQVGGNFSQQGAGDSYIQGPGGNYGQGGRNYSQGSGGQYAGTGGNYGQGGGRNYGRENPQGNYASVEEAENIQGKF